MKKLLLIKVRSSFLSEFQRQRSVRSTNDKSKLILDDETDTDVRQSKLNASVRSNSSSNSQPLKMSGLSYAFSSNTLPNSAATNTTIANEEGRKGCSKCIKVFVD